MANEQREQPICKSVFKSGENTISKEKFTQKWIDLINTLEKNKGVNTALR